MKLSCGYNTAFQSTYFFNCLLETEAQRGLQRYSQKLITFRVIDLKKRKSHGNVIYAIIYV